MLFDITPLDPKTFMTVSLIVGNKQCRREH
jgi:hypothetical protein